MSRRTKEEIEEEKRRERIRALRKGPDLDKYFVRKRNFITYAQGARMYSINYYSFVKLAKKAKANIRVKKKVVVDLDMVEEYLKNHCIENGGEH